MEIKYYDHRIISKKLNLYITLPESPGTIFWLSKGWNIFNKLKLLLVKSLKLYNYKEVNTPYLLNIKLWKISGHWKYFKNFMYVINNNMYALKPMNCPSHIKIFSNKLRSYKNLPLRISEFGTCFRNEYSGGLYGLMRLNQFTQDDAHIFCTKNQITKEITNCIKLMYNIYKKFNFNNIKVELSTRPIKKMGSNNIWNISEQILKKILKFNNIKYLIKANEGAFYGPKIEFSICDKYNRYWQCGTIQLDFILSKHFKITFINKNNINLYPIIIHRTILGSLERFIGIILENNKGNLPLWLSPINIMIINITKLEEDYTIKINNKLKDNNLNTLLDISESKLSYKIRNFFINKIPYLIICGSFEKKEKLITIKTRDNKEFKNLSLKRIITILKHDIKINNNNLLGDEIY